MAGMGRITNLIKVKGINKICSLVLAMLLISGVFTGCVQQKSQTDSSPTATVSPIATMANNGQAQANTSVYPLKIKDATGVEMTVEKKPEAIVSMILGTDEILVSLTDKSKIKALSGKIAEKKGISNITDIAKDYMKVESNIETVISLKPDIVFAADYMRQDAIKQLRDAGIVVFCTKTPTNIEEQKEVILEVANIIGENEKGRQIVEDMDKKLKEIEDKVKTLKDEEKLTALSYNSYGSTYSKGTTFDDIITKAGLINAAAKAGLDAYAQISKEKIIEINPDVIFLPDWSYDESEDMSAFAEELKKDKSLASVNAIKNNRIYLLPEKHMSSVSQYVVLGVEDAAKAAYPHLFE